MSKSHVSTIPMKPGAVNPSYGLVDDMIDRKEEFNAIAKRIVLLARAEFGKTDLGPGEMVRFRAIVAERLSEYKARWVAMVKEIVETPPAPQVMPSPPPAKELYGRIADGSEIVDVGSGNCLRLAADSGRLKITAIDPVVGDLPITIKRIPREVRVEDVADKFVTSHNVICQLPPGDVRSAIVSSDGLHLSPDHKELIAQGSATPIGTQIAVNAPGQVFLDYPVDEPGYVVTAGYKLIPRYRKRVIHLDAPGEPAEWDAGDYVPKIDCSPCGPGDIDWNDMGWKWDGVPLEIEISGDTGWVTRRDGRHTTAVVDGDVADMSLHVEWLREQSLLVLLRVEFYRGMIPPHSGELLRVFCESIDLHWGPCRLVAPPVFDLTVGPRINNVLCPVDGIITRVRQRDFYVKPYWTVDLRPADLAAVENHMRDIGKRVIADRREGLWEYRVTRSEETFVLEPVRERVDKLSSTTLGTVDYLFGLPTLTELVAVTGMTPEVQGLASYFIEV